MTPWYRKETAKPKKSGRETVVDGPSTSLGQSSVDSPQAAVQITKSKCVIKIKCFTRLLNGVSIIEGNPTEGEYSIRVVHDPQDAVVE
jgi:hypothetical protein